MYLEVLKQQESFGLRFLGLNDREKSMTIVFNGKKLTSKLYRVYLDAKLQQKRCLCCI